jgi:hypothetical protein
MHGQNHIKFKHYNIDQKDDRGRDGGTNFILRIKEQETRPTLHEHDDNDDNDDDDDVLHVGPFQTWGPTSLLYNGY